MKSPGRFLCLALFRARAKQDQHLRNLLVLLEAVPGIGVIREPWQMADVLLEKPQAPIVALEAAQALLVVLAATHSVKDAQCMNLV